MTVGMEEGGPLCRLRATDIVVCRQWANSTVVHPENDRCRGLMFCTDLGPGLIGGRCVYLRPIDVDVPMYLHDRPSSVV